MHWAAMTTPSHTIQYVLELTQEYYNQQAMEVTKSAHYVTLNKTWKARLRSIVCQVYC